MGWKHLFLYGLLDMSVWNRNIFCMIWLSSANAMKPMERLLDIARTRRGPEQLERLTPGPYNYHDPNSWPDYWGGPSTVLLCSILIEYCLVWSRWVIAYLCMENINKSKYWVLSDQECIQKDHSNKLLCDLNISLIFIQPIYANLDNLVTTSI